MNKPAVLTDFSVRLSLAMGQCNLSRVALARELAVDKTVVARWANGTNLPTEHNLTRLTEIVRRHAPDFTLALWRGPFDSFARAVGAPAPALDTGNGATPPAAPSMEAPPTRLTLAGLQRPTSPSLGGPYLGLWAGFHQSMTNRGCVLMSVARFLVDDLGLRFAFTDGFYVGEGPVIISGARLQCVMEAGPLYDRLGFFTFNGIHSARATVIDGVAATYAGDGTPMATTMILFRIDGGTRYGEVGLENFMATLGERNLQSMEQAKATGDLAAAWRDIAPAMALRVAMPRVGAGHEDGDINHVLRVSSADSLAAGFEEQLPEHPAIVDRLRSLLGLT